MGMTERKPMIEDVLADPKDTSVQLCVTATGCCEEVEYYYYLISKIELEDPSVEYVTSYGTVQKGNLFYKDNLKALTKYHYYVVVEDFAGNVSTVYTGKFITKKVHPTDTTLQTNIINASGKSANDILSGGGSIPVNFSAVYAPEAISLTKAEVQGNEDNGEEKNEEYSYDLQVVGFEEQDEWNPIWILFIGAFFVLVGCGIVLSTKKDEEQSNC